MNIEVISNLNDSMNLYNNETLKGTAFYVTNVHVIKFVHNFRRYKALLLSDHLTMFSIPVKTQFINYVHCIFSCSVTVLFI